jgi:conjugal transfer/entry exclusion protein
MNDTPKNDQPTYAMLAKMRDRAKIAEKQLAAVTEQLDSYKERYLKLAGKYAIEMHKITEQRDTLQDVIDEYADDKSVLATIAMDFKEQRDRLAAVLQRIRDGYGGQVASPNCCEDCDFLLPIDKALQSLTQKQL